MHISTTSLRNYEQGKTFPDESNLIQILRLFEIDTKSLMSETYAKTEEIKDLLEEEYFAIRRNTGIYQLGTLGTRWGHNLTFYL